MNRHLFVNINMRLSMEINDNDPYQSNNILEREDSQDSQDPPKRILARGGRRKLGTKQKEEKQCS